MAIMGSTDVAEYTRKEIRAIIGGEKSIPVTLAPQATVLEPGTVLGMITASNLFDSYKDSNTDGTQVARVILRDYVEPSTTSQIVSVYLSVFAKKNQLIGFDTGAMTDLGAREPIPGVIVIPGC